MSPSALSLPTHHFPPCLRLGSTEASPRLGDKWFIWEVIPGDMGRETRKEAIKGCVDEPATSRGQWGPLGTAEPSRGAQPEDEELVCLFITSRLPMGRPLAGVGPQHSPPWLVTTPCWGEVAGVSVVSCCGITGIRIRHPQPVGSYCLSLPVGKCTGTSEGGTPSSSPTPPAKHTASGLSRERGWAGSQPLLCVLLSP